MPQPPLDRELALAAVAALREHGTITKAAAALKLARTTLQSRLRSAALLGVGEDASGGDSVSVNGDHCQITKSTSERVRTLADLIRVCQIDTVEWTVERWICNKWDSAAKLGKDTTERIAVTELYQVKVWLKRNAALLAARDELADLIAAAKAQIRTPAIVKRLSKSSSGNCAEVSIFDLHNGKLAWGPETGGAHYDSKIADGLFRSAVTTLLERVAAHRPERILLPIGNDLLHYDTKQITTTSGTPQNTDGRFHKLFVETRRQQTWAIQACRAVAPVDVLVVPGNHDTLGAFCLGDSLSCFFHTAKDVRIENAPTLRKYYEWGAAMLLFTHGDKGKRPNYPLLMAREQPEMWARTFYREAHTGHLHQTQVQEFHGVRVRILPSLCAADAWHSENMYVGNMRAAEAFVWNKSEGLIATAVYTAPDDLKKGRAA
jgi:hypothetical protein